jgi:hypothetical protein
MRVKLRTNMAGPNGCYAAGDTIDVTAEEGERLVRQKHAEPVADEAKNEPQYRPWPKEGCLLSEAVERTSNPKLWDTAVQANQKLDAAGGRNRRRKHPWLARDRENDYERLDRERTERHWNALRAEADNANRALRQAFVAQFCDERLIAEGSYRAPSAEPSLIRGPAWKQISIVSWPKSIIREDTPDKNRWYDVRVFPALLASNVADLLAGLSIGEAFYRYVIQDAEAAALAARMLQREKRHHDVFCEGQFPGPVKSFKWPTLVTAAELAYCFVEAPILDLDRPSPEPSAAVKNVAAAIADRFETLRRLLVEGRISSRGTYARTGDIGDIDRHQWNRQGILLDIRNSDLLEMQGHASVMLWTGISLEPARRGAGDRTVPERSAPSSPAGEADQAEQVTPALAPANDKIEAQSACSKWLMEEMRKSPKTKLGTKVGWRTKAKQKWPAVSGRAFDDIWRQAIKGSGAKVWGDPGAPRR